MATPIVDTEWVSTFTGISFEDNEERADFLVEVASDLVLSYCNQTWTPVTAPIEARIAVAVLVGMGWASDAEAAQLRSEQIGDYRVEFANSPALAMDIDRVAHLLKRYRRASSYSIITRSSLEGPMNGDSVLESLNVDLTP